MNKAITLTGTGVVPWSFVAGLLCRVVPGSLG